MTVRPTDLALSPYRVLDLTGESGWLCGRLLGDLGADVIKIEPPGGDPGRRHGPFYDGQVNSERSLTWFALNFNKRGITLNIQTADGRALFRRLAATADFVIESFPPGCMETLGLGYSSLRSTNPRLVMTSITPFGQTGPYWDYKADDLVALAMGGLMAITGDPDRAPLRVGVPLAYFVGASHAAAGTMIAHYQRQRTGRGKHVDVSVQEAVVDTLQKTSQTWYVEGKVHPRGGREYGGRMMRDIHRARDGCVHFQVHWGPGPGKSAQALAEWMRSVGYKADYAERELTRLTDRDVTQEQIDRWQREIEGFFGLFTKRQLYAEALKRRIILFPVDSPEDIEANEQLAARSFFHEVYHPDLRASLRYPGPLGRFSACPTAIYRPAPLIGQHNDEVYGQELGYAPEELVSLKEAGVV